MLKQQMSIHGKTTFVACGKLVAVTTGQNTDPRIRRTRQLLQEGLGKLLEGKEFDKISVQDIADAATVNRATFYDHYNDKFALLECMVGARFHELLAERQVQFDGTCGSALQAIVLALGDYLVRMQGADGKRRLEPHMESAIIAVLRRILLDGLRRHPPENASPELVAAAVSWAVYGAAREWLVDPDRNSPEAMAEAVSRLVWPVLHRSNEPAKA